MLELTTKTLCLQLQSLSGFKNMLQTELVHNLPALFVDVTSFDHEPILSVVSVALPTGLVRQVLADENKKNSLR